MTPKAYTRLLVLAVTCLFLFLLTPLTPAAGDERILQFTSNITVHPDSTLTVTETIRVRSEAREIKRGIVRDFPTTYKDRLGNTVKVDFTVQRVLRDGREEPYRIEKVANGEKIYIGQKDVFLRPGVYTYTITYLTGRQLGYFKEFDELYWNVTGNAWTFPIDQAQAIIELPPDARVLNHAAYTGPTGARGQDFMVRPDKNGNLVFTATRTLSPGEGLTVAVSWPKGIVREPTGQERAASFLKDNQAAAVGLLWLVIIGAFYLFTWVKVGRDPAKGTIIPLFTPPQDFSPEAVRYLMRLGFDEKAFAAAVVNMAVKGYLTIEENGEEYTLHRKGADTAQLARGEIKVADKLFSGGQEIELKEKNHSVIKNALDALKSNLKMELEKIYFVANSRYLVPGIILSLLALGSIILVAPEKPVAAGLTVWLAGWTAACYFLAVQVHRKWESSHGFGKIFGTLVLALVVLPFFAFEILGLGAYAYAISPLALVPLLGIVFLNPLFYRLLKAPTLSGRKIMDQIEGFKLYLSVAKRTAWKSLIRRKRPRSCSRNTCHTPWLWM